MTKNRNRTEDWYKISMWLASAALIIAGLVMIIWKTIDEALVITVLLGAIVIMFNFFQYLGMEKKSRDERIRKIGTLAATYSWYTTLVFMCFLLFSGYYAHRDFKVAELFGLVIFVMVSTMLIINSALNLKGDIE
jgi:NADH:ubiquinone oxidoreductase subunit 6 (subunit J)